MLKHRNEKWKGDKEGYLWKSVRIKKEYFYIFNFLKYHCIINNLDDELIFDKIINFGLDNIKNNNVYYNFAYYNDKRLVKTFFISKKTLNRYDEFYIEFKNRNNMHKVYKSELYELCIYLYVKNNFSDIEKQMIKFSNTNFGINENKLTH